MRELNLRLVSLESPKFANSAGRLCSLLLILQPGRSYHDSILAHSNIKKEKVTNEVRAQSFIEFMPILTSTYHQFLDDVRTSPSINDTTRELILSGLARLVKLVYPLNPTGAPEPFTESERALLEVAGSLLPLDNQLLDSDRDRLRDSINALDREINSSQLPDDVRIALLEMVRLARNAVDQFNIYGTQGFKEAFKRMLAELMEVRFEADPAEVAKESWWTTAIQLLKTMDEIGSRLLKYQPLIEQAAPLLLNLR